MGLTQLYEGQRIDADCAANGVLLI